MWQMLHYKLYFNEAISHNPNPTAFIFVLLVDKYGSWQVFLVKFSLICSFFIHIQFISSFIASTFLHCIILKRTTLFCTNILACILATFESLIANYKFYPNGYFLYYPKWSCETVVINLFSYLSLCSRYSMYKNIKFCSQTNSLHLAWIKFSDN